MILSDFLSTITAKCPGLTSIWLVGSRANGTAHDKSDWDLIAFGSEEQLQCISRLVNLHHPEVDLLVVINGNDFRNAWGSKLKSGSLSSWKWKQITDTEAEYTEAKWVENSEQAKIVHNRRKAIRVWSL